MAFYEMQESNLPAREDGKRLLFPRMKLTGQVNLDYIAARIGEQSTFSTGDIKGLIQALSDVVADAMASGQSVKIEGLGLFTPSLGLRDGFEYETAGEDETKRNASSIYVNNVRFKADKELLSKTQQGCRLERSPWKFRKSSDKYTPQQRLALALKYLETNPVLTIAEYSRLTGLLHDAASRELRKWKDDPKSGIGIQGRGSHRVYVKAEKA